MNLRRLRRGFGWGLVAFVAIGLGAGIAISQIDLRDYRETLTSRAETALGRDVDISGDLDLVLGFSPRVTLGEITVAKTDSDQRSGDFLTAKRIQVDIGLLPLLWGQVRLRRVVLDSPTIHIAGGDHGGFGPNIAKAGKAANGNRENPLTGLRGFTVTNATVHYTTGSLPKTRTLHLDRLTANSDDSWMNLSGLGAYNGTEVTLSGRIGAPALALETSHHYPIEVAFAALDTVFKVNGTVIDPIGAQRLDLDLAITSEHPERLAARLGAPAVPSEPLHIETRVTGTDSRYALRGFSAKYGKSQINGRMALDWHEGTPRLKGNLAAPRLDISLLRKAANAEPGKSSDESLRDIKLPWSLLSEVATDISIEVGAIPIAGGLHASNLNTRIQTADGTLSIAPLEIDLGGGRLKATLQAFHTDSKNRINVKADISKLRYGTLLKDLGLTDSITGSATLASELTAQGETVQDLITSLNGRIGAVSQDGHINNSLLQTASSGLATLLRPWREREKGMTITCAIARFDAKDGHLKHRILLVDTPTASLTGDGAIDLTQGQYDLYLTPHAKHASLMSLAIPMRVTGPLNKPQISPSPLGAAKAGAIAVGSVVNPLATIGALVLESETTDETPCVKALNTARNRLSDSKEDGSTDTQGVDGFFNSLTRSLDTMLDGQKTDEANDEAVLQNRGGGGKR